MKVFNDLYHTFHHEGKKAEVWKDEHGNWGCRYWEGNIWKFDEIYKGHSEVYAESAAENYVMGIKNAG